MVFIVEDFERIYSSFNINILFPQPHPDTRSLAKGETSCSPAHAGRPVTKPRRGECPVASAASVLFVIGFASGETYADFNPDVDQVAAWTIGGLVAGKVLAKVGFFALILKFWKIILVGLGAVGIAVRKFFLRKKEQEEQQPTVLPE
ncbi:MAG: DUF2167 domain-containing protein [Flavobacteriales bacterium]